MVILTLFREHFLSEDSVFMPLRISVNAGCFGGGRCAISLQIIPTTVEMDGLSLANSCTHNSPTCMHLNISSWKHASNILPSINVFMLSSFHNFHAWKYSHTINVNLSQQYSLEGNHGVLHDWGDEEYIWYLHIPKG